MLLLSCVLVDAYGVRLFVVIALFGVRVFLFSPCLVICRASLAQRRTHVVRGVGINTTLALSLYPIGLVLANDARRSSTYYPILRSHPTRVRLATFLQPCYVRIQLPFLYLGVDLGEADGVLYRGLGVSGATDAAALLVDVYVHCHSVADTGEAGHCVLRSARPSCDDSGEARADRTVAVRAASYGSVAQVRRRIQQGVTLFADARLSSIQVEPVRHCAAVASVPA